MKVFTVLLVLFSIGTLFTVQSPYTPSQETSTITTSAVTTYTPLGITVSTDKGTYAPGETILVSGTVTGDGYLCGTGVTGCTFTSNIIVELEVWDPLNSRVYSKSLSLNPAPLYPGSEPRIPYSDSFGLSNALVSGTFQVDAAAHWTGSTAYARSSFRLEGTASTGCGQWVVATDKQAYVAGETVHITGYAGTSCVTFGCGTSPVIRLNYSSGSLDIQGQPCQGTNCTQHCWGGSYFYADWQIPSTFSPGTVTITVFDPTMPNIAEGATTFAVTTVTAPPTRVWLVLDRQQYTVGDTVEATAWYYGPPSVHACPLAGVEFGFYVFDDLGTQVWWNWASLVTPPPTNETFQGYVNFEYAIPTNARPGLYQAHLLSGLGCGAAWNSFPSNYPGAHGGYTAMFWVLRTPALGSLLVNFDKATYYAGDTVHITGDTSTPSCTWTYTSLGGLAVAITIHDPNGSLVLNSTTNPSVAGYKNYAYDYVLPANAILGNYTVAVSYGSCGAGCFGCVFGQGTFQVGSTTTPMTTPVTTPVATPAPPPGPGIPGFSIEAIIVGLAGGLVALILVRRRRSMFQRSPKDEIAP